MAEHYGAGESAPHQIVVHEDSAETAVTAAETVPGIDRASVTGTTPDGWAVLSAVGTAQPESPAAIDEAEGLRDTLHDLWPGPTPWWAAPRRAPWTCAPIPPATCWSWPR